MAASTFGPQLIGQTEKALSALLRKILDGRLSESQWVTLRLSEQMPENATSSHGLAAMVVNQTGFGDAAALVQRLTDVGLLACGRPTAAGRATLDELQAKIAAVGRIIWKDLPADDVSAATRVLNEVLSRARVAMA